jgi:hypothetical protein
MIETDFNIGFSSFAVVFVSTATFSPLGKLRQPDKHTLIWGCIRTAQRCDEFPPRHHIAEQKADLCAQQI